MKHNIGIKSEITNEELIRLVQQQHNKNNGNDNYPMDSIKKCLKITDLVEFAKYSATEDEFKAIISLFYELSNKQNVNKD